MKIAYQKLFERIEIFSDAITQTFNIAGTLLIVFVMVIVNIDVIGRELFLVPVAGVPMMVSMSIVAIVFLQTPQTFKQGRLTQNSAILDTIGKKSPAARLGIELIFSAAAFYLILQIFLATFPLFKKAWVRNTYEGTIGDFTAPIWPIKFIILLGCALLMVQIFLFFMKKVLVFLHKEGTKNEPV